MLGGYETEIIAGVGIFLGCLARAVLPFFHKKAEAAKNGADVKWERRYSWTIIFAVFVAVIATMMILPTFQVPTAFIYGWAAQDIINKVAK